MSEELYSKLCKSPYFRYFRRSWNDKTPWTLDTFIPDDLAVTRGYVKCGQGRNAGVFPYKERLEFYELLSNQNRLQNSDLEKLEKMLGKVPFFGPIGILDIDICDKSKDYNAERTKLEADGLARELAKATEKYGLGRPRWYRTNELGGYHADLVAPEDCESPALVIATGLLVKKLANEIGVPLLSELPQDRNKRPPLYIDDSVLRRYPNARGGLWRLPGTNKGPGTYAKTYIDLLNAESYTTVNAQAIAEVLPQAESICNARQWPEGEETSVILNIRESYDTTPEDQSLVEHSPGVISIFNDNLSTDRSRRDFEVVLQALKAGASDDQAIRLMRAMPGSKATQDNRSSAYDRSILRSAKAVSVVSKNFYDGFVRPRDLTSGERLVIEKAFDFCVVPKRRKALRALLGCGSVHTFSEVGETGLVGAVHTHRCERSICPHCGPRRVFLQVKNALEAWPERVFVKNQNTKNDTQAACRDAITTLKSEAHETLGNKAKKLLAKSRIFKAPGRVLVVTASSKAMKLSGFVEVSKQEALQLVKTVLYTRLLRVQEHLVNDDALALASDLWVSNTVSVSSGRRCKALPWLSKSALRDRSKFKKTDEIKHVVAAETGELLYSAHAISSRDIAKSVETLNKTTRYVQRPPN